MGQQQVIGIHEMYDKIREFKEVIELLTISPAKNYNGEETVIKMISRLKAALKCKQDLIIQEEFENSEIFSDLYYKRINALDELNFKGEKLAKLVRLKNQIIFR